MGYFSFDSGNGTYLDTGVFLVQDEFRLSYGAKHDAIPRSHAYTFLCFCTGLSQFKSLYFSQYTDYFRFRERLSVVSKPKISLSNFQSRIFNQPGSIDLYALYRFFNSRLLCAFKNAGLRYPGNYSTNDRRHAAVVFSLFCLLLVWSKWIIYGLVGRNSGVSGACRTIGMESLH